MWETRWTGTSIGATCNVKLSSSVRSRGRRLRPMARLYPVSQTAMRSRLSQLPQDEPNHMSAEDKGSRGVCKSEGVQ